jgi:pimeloyl-ACP methyl ester carboxylesterase
MAPTIILVHGAFAESASWDGVIEPLAEAGHPVIAAANPLRGLAADARAIGDLVRSVDGPVVLVGHSYGGAVISNVAADAGEITGLVYVAGFVPDTGERCLELSAKFPGSTLSDAIRPTPRNDGTTDLRIAQELFHDQFAADLPATMTARMSVTQRPVTLEALQEPAGERPLWKELPSWFVYGDEDVFAPEEPLALEPLAPITPLVGPAFQSTL